MPDIALLGSFHFLRPWWLLALLPLCAALLLRRSGSDRAREWQALIAPHLLHVLIVPAQQTRGISPRQSYIWLLVLLVLALAGPSWTRVSTPFAQDKAPLAIAIDLSASMASRDLQPDRLQRARDKILGLTDARGDAYTALLAYAGSAHQVLPLSDDRDVLLYFLDALQTGMLPRRGKSPELALPLAEAALHDQASAGTLLLITDGANAEAETAFRDFSTRTGIQLLIWGMGLPVDVMNRELERGLDPTTPTLQETALRQLATAAGGYYRTASTDDADIRDLQRRIRQHFAQADNSTRPWVDAGYFLLAPIILLFLLGFRRGWVPQW